MSTPNTPCAHVFTSGRHTPVSERAHGWMHVDVITCADCDEKVILRVYDDRRDDPMRNRPLTWGENHHRVDGRDGQQ
ncbi:hypothetical protein GCM10009809_39960 [Isoptericola hypogeus]|uniref:Uncharacterized protein n=1 Tax=Isoptericola hypogeus TaxID=300179 RepID=A0ABN2JW31_9MICO